MHQKCLREVLGYLQAQYFDPQVSFVFDNRPSTTEIAPEVTGHGLPLSKREAYNRVHDQHCGSS